MLRLSGLVVAQYIACDVSVSHALAQSVELGSSVGDVVDQWDMRKVTALTFGSPAVESYGSKSNLLLTHPEIYFYYYNVVIISAAP
jgi:hypothetical protein